MDDTIEGFLAWAEARRWSVRRHRSDAVLPAVILSRYPQAPESYCRFLRTAALLVTPDEAGWFNCKADFDGASDAAFKWNELETMSLQAAADDESWTRSVMRFWDTHLPIVLSVKSGYAFYAIDVDNGAVVRGDEPEFEEVRVVAASFPEFLTFIMAGRSRCSVAAGPLRVRKRAKNSPGAFVCTPGEALDDILSPRRAARSSAAGCAPACRWRRRSR